MAESKVSICNKALSMLGVGKEIQNLESERSEESRSCRMFYSNALESTLRDFAWPFAKRTVTLELIQDYYSTEWRYAYRYPAMTALFRRIPSGNVIDTEETKIPHEIASDSGGLLVLTNQPSAKGEITRLIDNPAFYPADFVAALACRLAYYIAPRVTGGDPFGNQAKARQAYDFEIANARRNARSEEKDPKLPESELVTVRN